MSENFISRITEVDWLASQFVNSCYVYHISMWNSYSSHKCFWVRVLTAQYGVNSHSTLSSRMFKKVLLKTIDASLAQQMLVFLSPSRHLNKPNHVRLHQQNLKVGWSRHLRNDGMVLRTMISWLTSTESAAIHNYSCLEFCETTKQPASDVN